MENNENIPTTRDDIMQRLEDYGHDTRLARRIADELTGEPPDPAVVAGKRLAREQIRERERRADALR